MNYSQVSGLNRGSQICVHTRGTSVWFTLAYPGIKDKRELHDRFEYEKVILGVIN